MAFVPYHITAAGTANISQTSPVVLHAVISNKAAGAGTAIVINGTAAADANRSTVAVIETNFRQSYMYDIALGNGLIVVTTGTAPDLTVSYVTV